MTPVPLIFAGDDFYSGEKVHKCIIHCALRTVENEIRKSDRDYDSPLKFAGKEFVFWREAILM